MEERVLYFSYPFERKAEMQKLKSVLMGKNRKEMIY